VSIRALQSANVLFVWALGLVKCIEIIGEAAGCRFVAPTFRSAFSCFPIVLT
jgi:hypothetical protein